ncbi:MAG: hypothetical protein WDA71_14770 [Actinomycetota bacterium]
MGSRPRLWRGLGIATVLTLSTIRVAVAHGEPVITVNPPLAAAGSDITVTGSEMEPGEVFTISLEGAPGSTKLGEATAEAQGEEGGFEVTLMIPPETPPGSYTVRAATPTGESTAADLTVTPPSSQASADPAMVQEPSGEAHMLQRTKSGGLVAGVIGAAVLGAGLGLWLLVKKE